MKEIGSEFWLDEKTNGINNRSDASILSFINFGEDSKLLFLGRTAIDYVINDIKKTIKSVYMPSYCCDSMLQPFLSRNINIYFYDVIVTETGIEYLIDCEKEVDVFFAINYFGFYSSNMDYYIRLFKQRDITVIEDITHRLLSSENHSKNSDYCIASLRKWFALPTGGIAIKMKGEFSYQEITKPIKNIVDKKIIAMKKKAEYINKSYNSNKCTDIQKSDFLPLFSEFNSMLNNNYKNITMDILSQLKLLEIDCEKIITVRKQNALYLYENLSNIEGIRLLYPQINVRNDCPLFVPLRVKENHRDELRQHLISNNIFCPVHWPVSKKSELSNDTALIYKEELSLVCDQRYNYDDMKKIVKTIGEFISLL